MMIAVIIAALVGSHAATAALQRPLFHVTPDQGHWMNDPNGPVYFNGKYHLFFQYNPEGAEWGNMSWAHVVSEDLASWRRLPVALRNDEAYDSYGVFSGSVTIVDGAPVIAYTCVRADLTQLQCIARPKDASDPNLEQWVKDSRNPVIPTLPEGCDPTSFRDPTTAWFDDGKWWMVIAAGVDGVGVIPLYSSKDFIQWDYEGEIWNSSEDWVQSVKMIECPDLFKLSGSNLHVLKYSLETAPYTGLELYELGTYVKTKFIRDRRLHRGVLDYGHLYASKTFWDEKTGEHVLWGWSSEEDTLGAERGWQGIMALPRKIIFDEELGQLRTPPVDAINQLRNTRLWQKDRVELGNMKEAVLPVAGNQLEISFEAATNQCGGEFSVQLRVRRSQVGTEYTGVTIVIASSQSMRECGTIGVDRAKAGGSTPTSPYIAPIFCSDATRHKVSARVFVDVSVVEAYANDGASVITARMYPPEEYNGVSLFAVARGDNCAVTLENVQVYSMSSIGLDV